MKFNVAKCHYESDSASASQRNTLRPLAPGVWGIWGEGLLIFSELGSIGNYFHGSGEQPHNFRDLGSPAKK